MERVHIQHLAQLLGFVTKRNGSIISDSKKCPFHVDFPENLLMLLQRLDKYIRCSPSCYVAALLYLDRLAERNPDLILNDHTVNLLFATSLLAANQYLDDTPETSLQFARVTRVDPVFMANLKTEFLFRMRFDLAVSEKELHSYGDHLVGPIGSPAFQDVTLWCGEPLSTKKLSSPVSSSSITKSSHKSTHIPINKTTATTATYHAHSHSHSHTYAHHPYSHHQTSSAREQKQQNLQQQQQQQTNNDQEINSTQKVHPSQSPDILQQHLKVTHRHIKKDARQSFLSKYSAERFNPNRWFYSRAWESLVSA